MVQLACVKVSHTHDDEGIEGVDERNHGDFDHIELAPLAGERLQLCCWECICHVRIECMVEHLPHTFALVYLVVVVVVVGMGGVVSSSEEEMAVAWQAVTATTNIARTHPILRRQPCQSMPAGGFAHR